MTEVSDVLWSPVKQSKNRRQIPWQYEEYAIKLMVSGVRPANINGVTNASYELNRRQLPGLEPSPKPGVDWSVLCHCGCCRCSLYLGVACDMSHAM
jgi:hypothetical protein